MGAFKDDVTLFHTFFTFKFYSSQRHKARQRSRGRHYQSTEIFTMIIIGGVFILIHKIIVSMETWIYQKLWNCLGKNTSQRLSGTFLFLHFIMNYRNMPDLEVMTWNIFSPEKYWSRPSFWYMDGPNGFRNNRHINQNV